MISFVWNNGFKFLQALGSGVFIIGGVCWFLTSGFVAAIVVSALSAIEIVSKYSLCYVVDWKSCVIDSIDVSNSQNYDSDSPSVCTAKYVYVIDGKRFVGTCIHPLRQSSQIEYDSDHEQNLSVTATEIQSSQRVWYSRRFPHISVLVKPTARETSNSIFWSLGVQILFCVVTLVIWPRWPVSFIPLR